jgi:hypothetical protein
VTLGNAHSHFQRQRAPRQTSTSRHLALPSGVTLGGGGLGCTSSGDRPGGGFTPINRKETKEHGAIAAADKRQGTEKNSRLRADRRQPRRRCRMILLVSSEIGSRVSFLYVTGKLVPGIVIMISSLETSTTILGLLKPKKLIAPSHKPTRAFFTSRFYRDVSGRGPLGPAPLV